MKRPILFIMLLFLSGGALTAQLQVFSTAGGVAESSSGSVSWTLGETVVGSFEGSGNIVTQGFQQGNLEVTTVVETPAELDIQTSVYPNPVENILNVNIKNRESTNLNYALYEIEGKLLKEGSVESPSFSISLSDYPAGQYILQIYTEQYIINSFNVIKR